VPCIHAITQRDRHHKVDSPIERKDRNGRTQRYTYSGLNRQTQEDLPDIARSLPTNLTHGHTEKPSLK